MKDFDEIQLKLFNIESRQFRWEKLEEKKILQFSLAWFESEFSFNSNLSVIKDELIYRFS